MIHSFSEILISTYYVPNCVLASEGIKVSIRSELDSSQVHGLARKVDLILMVSLVERAWAL